MLVADASALVHALVADAGGPLRARLTADDLVCPDLVHVEVTSALRGLVRRHTLTARRAAAALDDVLDLPMVVIPAPALVRRTWELRGNLTPYDAAYVAVAEGVAAPLLTLDRRLASAPSLPCRVELIT